MLVLTRKIDQGILIADNIYIKVLGVERDRVKIGISAPVDIPVLREELAAKDDQRRKRAEKDGRSQADAPPTIRAIRNEPPPQSGS